jgi:hypothetical protein
MEDLTLRYFDAEMRYLREAAKEFAQTHPDRAAMLDLDKAGTPDPYVERLFEGFAFSMGRLRDGLGPGSGQCHTLAHSVALGGGRLRLALAEVCPPGNPPGECTVGRYRTTRCDAAAISHGA